MNPIVAAAVTQGIAALVEIWRVHANKPAGWEPTAEDWAELRRANAKTAADYERESVESLASRVERRDTIGGVMASAAPGVYEQTR